MYKGHKDGEARNRRPHYRIFLPNAPGGLYGETPEETLVTYEHLRASGVTCVLEFRRVYSEVWAAVSPTVLKLKVKMNARLAKKKARNAADYKKAKEKAVKTLD